MANFFTGIPSGLVGAIGGLGSGVFSMKNFWNGLMTSGALVAIKSFGPELWGSVLRLFGGEEAAKKAAKEVKEGGFPAVVKSSLAEGFTLSSGYNGVSGMAEAGSGGVGTMIGAGITMATVLAVTVGAIHHYNATDTKTAGASPQTPPSPAPAANAAARAK